MKPRLEPWRALTTEVVAADWKVLSPPLFFLCHVSEGQHKPDVLVLFYGIAFGQREFEVGTGEGTEAGIEPAFEGC